MPSLPPRYPAARRSPHLIPIVGQAPSSNMYASEAESKMGQGARRTAGRGSESHTDSTTRLKTMTSILASPAVGFPLCLDVAGRRGVRPGTVALWASNCGAGSPRLDQLPRRRRRGAGSGCRRLTRCERPRVQSSSVRRNLAARGQPPDAGWLATGHPNGFNPTGRRRRSAPARTPAPPASTPSSHSSTFLRRPGLGRRRCWTCRSSRAGGGPPPVCSQRDRDNPRLWPAGPNAQPPRNEWQSNNAAQKALSQTSKIDDASARPHLSERWIDGSSSAGVQGYSGGRTTAQREPSRTTATSPVRF